MPTPTLETARLLLRPAIQEDAVWAQKLFPHWDIVKHMAGTIPWPYPANGAENYYRNVIIAEMNSGQSLCWTIVEKSSNESIGTLTLTPNDKKDNRGFWLGLPYHGKGYMSEAVIVTTDYAFDVLGMPRLLLNNAKENVASSKLKIKAGATVIGEESAHYVCGQITRVRWELLPDAWRASPLKNAGNKA